MAKKEKTPAERAQYSYDTKKEYDKLYTPKDRAKDRYKANKEYRKLEKRGKLPRFLIIIIAFILFVGVFAGLYANYDYELEFKPKEFVKIDLSESSDVLSSQLRSAFYSFFLVLDNISNLAEGATSYLSADLSVSEIPEISVYLINLKTDSLTYIENNHGIVKRLYYNNRLNKFINAFGNPDYTTLQYTYLVPGKFHIKFAHEKDLLNISDDFGWNAELIHNDFVELEICHLYNGSFYGYCHHGEHVPDVPLPSE